MDKYDASNDHYCYPDSGVLRNLLNIRDEEVLSEAERDITSLRIDDVYFTPPPYNLGYLQRLHATLFTDLFGWAGQIRTVDIAKGGTRFCHCNRIIPETDKLFSKLAGEQWLAGLSRAEICPKLAEYYCEFNMIHPFREGNGRVQRLFFEHLSLSAGYALDWSAIAPDEWVQANIDGVIVNYEPMQRLFLRIVN